MPAGPPLRVVSRVERVTSKWVGPCFLLFMVAGLLTNGYVIATGKLNLFARTPSWSGFMHGESMEDIALAISNAPVPKLSARIEREASWLVTRDLGGRVREGERDWLFLADEFTPHAKAGASAASRAEEVIALNKRLAARGIALLVAVVPDKSRIEADRIGALHRSPGFASRVTDWVGTLTAGGVRAVDLTPALAAVKGATGATAFLRTDTHWGEEGAAAAAKVVAQQVRALGMTPSPSVQTVIATQTRVQRPGDLVRLAGIDGLPLALQPTPEAVQRTTFEAKVVETATTAATSAPSASTSPTTSPTTSPSATPSASPLVSPSAASAPTQEQDDSDLFGDDNLPNIVLVGTSFSTTSNFAPFLDFDLGTKVANFGKEGGDFAGSIKAYLNGPSFKQTPPKLIIWEIPERVLGMNRNGDKVE